MRLIESQNKMYDIVHELCQKKGVSIANLCADTGLKTQMFTELKSGRTKTLSLKTISTLVEYFDVSADVFIL